MSIGSKIRSLREKTGKSGEKFATEVMISGCALNKFEHDIQVPSLATAARIATALGVTVDELLKEDG